MFTTFKQKLLLGVFIFVILSIPVASYLVSEYKNTTKGTQDKKTTQKAPKVTPKSSLSPAKQLLDLAKDNKESSSPTPSPSPTPSSPTIATAYGPTLSLKVTLDGRPKEKWSTRLFVGIIDGELSQNPKFLLSFSIDLPDSGEYSQLSIAGLSAGSRYTALLKGSSQIAKASEFTMAPTVTYLNSGEAINLLSGDLNEDNVINSADFSIARKALGSSSQSANWNENIDLNRDGIINIFDISIITRNIGQIGASGAWTSAPQIATPSAGLAAPAVGGPNGQEGHWIWVPEF